MKIVFPVLSLETGGGTRFIYHLSQALADKGHEVEIVMPENAPQVWPLRIKLTLVPELTAPYIPSADFILPNYYKTVFPALESKKGQVVRLSLGYEPLWISNEEARNSYLINAPILCVSNWLRQMILEDIGLEGNVIISGIDHATFHPYPKKSETTGRKSIFYIMRDPRYGYTWKGGPEFEKAITRLRKELDFDIVMAFPEKETMNISIPYERVNPVTDDELARIYGEADIFVYNSYFESFGLPPLEAMACGTAVVTTDCGGNRDYTKNGENCLVVPPSDIDGLCEAIYHLLTNDSERERIAINGQISAQDWTWQKTAGQVEAVLQSLS